MDGLVLAIGGALILASGANDGQLHDLWNLVGDNSTQSQPVDHKRLLMLAGEVLFLLILAMIAGASEEGGKMIIALLLALWLVWLINNQGPTQKFLGAFTQFVPKQK